MQGEEVNVNNKTYKLTGGGYVAYGTLVNNDNPDADVVNDTMFAKLLASEKQRFLGDMFTICNAMVSDTEAGLSTVANEDKVTNETVTSLMEILQTKTGMGTQLLATLLQNTKPDYVTANRIYAPFSGVVGTMLGVLSIVMMALLTLTMALDIAYITVPAFQLMLNGDSDGGQGGKGEARGMNRIISIEARQAVMAVESEGGQGGQNGSSGKTAVGIYFKRRWKGLIIFGICLLYLVQGQIWGLVGRIIDLLSGFLG